jgi:hypothetical protein
MKKLFLLVVILLSIVACGVPAHWRRADVIIYNQQGQEIETFTDVKVIEVLPIAGTVEFEMDGKRFTWTGKFDIFYKEN